jgi:hypothetical protein
MHPSGASREAVFSHPELWGGIQCLQALSDEQSNEVGETLQQVVATAGLSDIPREVADFLEQLQEDLPELPPITGDTAWELFQLVLSILSDHLTQMLYLVVNEFC